MAIKASAQITLSSVRDVEGTWRYYKLQSSTLAAPAKPTANPPGGWTLTEPTYSEGSTTTLYTVELNKYSDGTFAYSAVSVSASFEAAKAAYNKAQAAQGQVKTVIQRFTSAGIDVNNDAGAITALVQRIDKAQTTADGVQVGGRNLAPNSNFEKTYQSGITTSKHPALYAVEWGGYNSGISNPETSYHAHINNTTFSGENVYEFNESDGTRGWKGIASTVDARLAKRSGEYVISADLYATGAGTKIFGGFYYVKSGTTTYGFHSGQYLIKLDTVGTWKRYSASFKLNDDVDWDNRISLYVYGFGFSSDSVLYVRNLYLGYGNRATDWTPAPEDVDSDIRAAASTANTALSRVTTAESRLEQTEESIRGTVKKTDLSTLVDGLATKEALQSMQTQTTQTASELSAAVTRISQTEDGLETYIKRMIFDLSGLHIRAGDAAKTELNLTEEQILFKDALGNVCATIAQKLMTIENVQIGQTMQIGGGIWRVLGDGSIGLFKK